MVSVSKFKKAFNAVADSLLGVQSVQGSSRPTCYEYFTYTKPVYIGGDKDVNSFLDYLAIKYDFKSIIVFKEKHGILGHCRWESSENLQKVTSLFSSLRTEASQSAVPSFEERFNCLYLNAGDWYSFYRWKDYVFAVRANDSVPVPELFTVARDLAVFLRNGKAS